MIDVKYSEIDVEIRKTISLINDIEGVETVYSCSGHKEGEQGYISFVVKNLCELEKLIQKLPKSESGFISNQPFSKNIWVSADLLNDKLTFSIRFLGYPFYVHKMLLEDI